MGKNVVLAGQVGVAGHCKIGDGVIAIAQSGIPHDVPAGQMISGAPAIDFKLWLKCSAVYSQAAGDCQGRQKALRTRVTVWLKQHTAA